MEFHRRDSERLASSLGKEEKDIPDDIREEYEITRTLCEGMGAPAPLSGETLVGILRRLDYGQKAREIKENANVNWRELIIDAEGGGVPAIGTIGSEVVVGKVIGIAPLGGLIFDDDEARYGRTELPRYMVSQYTSEVEVTKEEKPAKKAAKK